MARSRLQDPLGKLTTGEHIAAGAVSGAIGGVLGVVLRRPNIVVELDIPQLWLFLGAMGMVGCFVGAVLGPLAAKTLLHAVPAGRGIGWTGMGTALAMAFAPAPEDGESMVPALLSPFGGFLITALALWGWHGMKGDLAERDAGETES